MRTQLLLIAIIALAGCEAPPSVTVDDELLVGNYVGENVATFLGVPFAEPPVGDLRWRAPQALTSRLERRETTEFAAACMQTMRILDWYRSMAVSFGASPDYYDDLQVSEDCLYLNLWTPTLESDAKLPVMVWVHGGSNKSGWSYEDNYRGHILAAQGVVVITVAYRQGVFGFLSHPELEGEDAVANFGLWDLVAALRWIQDNVEHFGGDPSRVTVFGESSGSENILALMFSGDAKNLFQRAALHSTAGYGLAMPTLQDEQRRGADLVAALGASSLQDLKKASAATLLETYTELTADHYHSPAIDGQLITESTWDSMRSERWPEHAVIIGTNADEYRDKTATAERYTCPSQSVAARRTASGGDAWMYFFSRVREDEASAEIGAYHGAEYPYVFGVHDDYVTTSVIDRELSTQMQKYWINFATSGDPNGADLPEWPMFERPDPLVQQFGDAIITIPATEPDICASFEASN